jgi:hypothetical protein
VISHCIPHALVPVAIAALLATPALFGQDDGGDGASTPLSEPPRGIHLYNASVYSEYVTNAYSLPGLGSINSLSAPRLGADEIYGGQITVAWQRYRVRTELSVMYSGGYDGMLQHSNLGGVNQSLTINLRRRVTTRWTVSVFGWASQQQMLQYMFAPESSGASAQSSVPVQYFAMPLSGGQFGTGGIASIQGGEAVGGAGGAEFSYMLTPHTTIGGDTSAYLISNRYEDARGARGNVFVARKMSRHWLLRAYGGGEGVHVSQLAASQPSMHFLIGGGWLGWQRRSQTLAAAYDRSSYDSFGSVVGRVNSETASWSWRHPSNIWSASVGLGEQQMSAPGFADITGWRGLAEFSFQLQNGKTVKFEYAHLHASGVYGGVFNRFPVDSIRMSLVWAPARFSH